MWAHQRFGLRDCDVFTVSIKHFAIVAQLLIRMAQTEAPFVQHSKGRPSRPLRQQSRPLSCSSTCRPQSGVLSVPQGVYVGIEIHPVSAFSIYVHDGYYEVDFCTQVLERCENFTEVADTDDPDAQVWASRKINGCEGDEHRPSPALTRSILDRMETAIINWLKTYAETCHFKIMAAGIGINAQDEDLVDEEGGRTILHWDHISSGLLRLHSRLWFDMDILPIFVRTCGYSLDERACSAARKAQLYLNPRLAGNIPRVVVGYKHRVEIDGSNKIHMVDIPDYKRTVVPHTWAVFEDLVKVSEKRKLRISFFNSTAQGGGVALMRHALLRLLGLTNIDVKWHVMKPMPEIFDITKRKFHNVLQGVADKSVHLTDDDKALFLQWCQSNVKRYWSGADGPVMGSDVIVIDDPQPCGIIPEIKRLNPSCKIIYRSHIEVTAHLADNPNTEQHHVWNFLWSFIQHADLFISHPVAGFVPSNVPREKLLMLPACTDALDGLNKPLDSDSMVYYQSVFNRVAHDAIGRSAQFGDRPYIVQVARFDPSKGLPQVLDAYRGLRTRLQADNVPNEKTPQLILAGHGSIDDPDGTLVFEQVLDILARPDFKDVKNDVVCARLPPSDQLLNCLMRGAVAALQLSTKEGFEIKVTEALAKGVPVIAYSAGGIPHQIIDGKTGYLVPVGDIGKVVDHLYALVTDKELREKMSRAARQNVNEEYFTVVAAINWLYLANLVVDGKPIPTINAGGLDGVLGDSKDEAMVKFELGRRALSGNTPWVKDLWHVQYKDRF
ncbi:hypothetical protein HDU86_004171 [Geranomyces michiganensis]|nr:hypothetical protein HDU86_004171 [Geranomyces michiganensis]